jgi:flagellar motor switch protein FliM
MEPPRRPSDLELPPLRRLSVAAVDALGDALGQFIEVQTSVRSIDLSAQLMALTAPSQMVLVMTYSLSIPTCGIAGDISVVLTLATLSPMLERLVAQANERSGIDVDPGLMRSVAEQIPVVVEARLDATAMTAGAVAGLRVGDVNRAGASHRSAGVGDRRWRAGGIGPSGPTWRSTGRRDRRPPLRHPERAAHDDRPSESVCDGL